jgi:predicted  nucleic acid-binding Zn-ribbon protein
MLSTADIYKSLYKSKVEDTQAIQLLLHEVEERDTRISELITQLQGVCDSNNELENEIKYLKYNHETIEKKIYLKDGETHEDKLNSFQEQMKRLFEKE